MKSVVVLQARMNSTRLPGKVLLPAGGLPLVVLAAKRAANTGKRVIVATSREASDDPIVEIARAHDICCYRGSLDNVLERVVSALNGYADTDLVFRLTADNVFPDGALLDAMEACFVNQSMDYLCCNGGPSGLPYGLSAELTLLGHLREALKSTNSAFDLEHVTPYVRRRFGETYFKRYQSLALGAFRCTVDCLDDYLDVQKIFSGIGNPIEVSATELARLLQGRMNQPFSSSLAAKLVLGTAQLGLSYGIANATGKPSHDVAARLIRTAIANGAAYIDTAQAYGDSEAVIGDVLRAGWGSRVKTITKLSPLDACHSDLSAEAVGAYVDASVYASCAKLYRRNIEILLLHRFSHLTEWGGAVWTHLLKLKREGLIEKLGVSVQTPEELTAALQLADVEHIQLPMNVLDWRWESVADVVRREKGRRGLVVHVRSALLQGLLPSKDPMLWKKANVSNPEPIISWLGEQCRRLNAKSVAEFCLVAIKSLDWVDGVVVGMETLAQLRENIRIFCLPDLSRTELMAITEGRPLLAECSLNPMYWK